MGNIDIDSIPIMYGLQQHMGAIIVPLYGNKGAQEIGKLLMRNSIFATMHMACSHHTFMHRKAHICLIFQLHA